jgi:hypothetical protein
VRIQADIARAVRSIRILLGLLLTRSEFSGEAQAAVQGAVEVKGDRAVEWDDLRLASVVRLPQMITGRQIAQLRIRRDPVEIGVFGDEDEDLI